MRDRHRVDLDLMAGHDGPGPLVDHHAGRHVRLHFQQADVAHEGNQLAAVFVRHEHLDRAAAEQAGAVQAGGAHGHDTGAGVSK